MKEVWQPTSKKKRSVAQSEMAEDSKEVTLEEGDQEQATAYIGGIAIPPAKKGLINLAVFGIQVVLTLWM